MIALVDQKWVSFHTEIGSRNNIGFIYGIDLKLFQEQLTLTKLPQNCFTK